jgi:acetyl esterase/lipase
MSPSTSPRMAIAMAMAMGLVASAGAAPQRDAPSSPAPSPPLSVTPNVAYPHKSVKRREFGTGARSYWLFEPADPTPESAPVVVFHHGWLAANPGVYGAWIEHLARSGRTVIFPRYQADWTTRPAEFLPNALTAVRDAFDVLQTSPHHVKPDRDRFALIGHSAGGNLSAQMAAVAAESGLPTPRSLVVLMPGEVKTSLEPRMAQIPSTTLLVVVAAEHDRVVGDLRARQIFAAATAVPPSRKKYVFYRTDRHGSPNLVADHLSPSAALALFDTGEGPFRSLQMTEAEFNAFDGLGFWRLADLTIEAGFNGQTLDEATHFGDKFRDLGRWSDGKAVLSPLVSDDLATMPRVVPTNGLRVIPWQAEGAAFTKY